MAAAREQVGLDQPPAADDLGHGNLLEIVEENEVGAVARRHDAAVGQPERGRGAERSRPVDRERRRAGADRDPHRGVDVALFHDFQRIAVVGAERDPRPGQVGEQRGERRDVLGDRALAHQDEHALGQLFAGLIELGALVVGADAGGQIAVERQAAQQGGMAVDVPPGEGRELREQGRIARDHARVVHDLGETKGGRIARERHQVVDLEPGARGLEFGRGNA